MRLRCVAAMGLVLAAASFARADVVTRVDDERVVGTVTRVDSAGSVVVQREKGYDVTIPADQVLSVRFDAKPVEPTGDWVVLASGERFRGQVDPVDGRMATPGLACRGVGSLQGALVVPFADLRAWVPAWPDAEKTLAEILALNNDRDVVFMANGDQLTGVVEAIDAAGVSVSAKLGATALKRESLRGAAFSKTLKPWREPARLLAEVHLVDGSIVLGDVVGSKDGVYTLHSVMGAKWTAAAGQIAEIRFRGGKLAWLSELPPEKAETTPFFNHAWPWRKDASVWGRPLTALGVTYDRGIGTHSRTEMTWDIAARFVAFVAEVAIDDETKGAGSALVSVTGDGRVLLSPTEINGGDKPKRIKLDVTGVRRLSLKVDYGKDEDAGDHVDWLNARLIRR